LSTPNPAVSRITLFAAINHLAKMADPRVSEPPAASIKAITDAVGLAQQGDPEFAAELSAWVEATAKLIMKVRA
jgi:hypothetical protein